MKTSERIDQLIHEGNIRCVVVRHDGRTVAAAPLTAVVIGAVIAPPLAVAAGLAALFTHSSVTIEPVKNGAGGDEEAGKDGEGGPWI